MVGADAFQRVDVEESRAVPGDAREHAVVERAFQGIGVARLAVDQG